VGGEFLRRDQLFKPLNFQDIDVATASWVQQTPGQMQQNRASMQRHRQFLQRKSRRMQRDCNTSVASSEQLTTGASPRTTANR
jgi:hypothetical protein